MTQRFTSLVAVAIAALAGCSQGTSGGPGAKDEKSAFGQTDNTFNLSVPTMSSSIQQGEKTEATVGIKRGKNFDGDVALKFADLPKGVIVEPSNPVIKHGDSEAKISFAVIDGAPLGDFKMKVTGHPKSGGDAVVDFKLTIIGKDSFSLSVPTLSTSIKQGETKTVSIGIKRDKKFDQDVALSFSELPLGVTLMPTDTVIKRGESEARVEVTGADDASLGKFAIKVTGHPATGEDSSKEFNITVAKK